ncbi:MAG TPA: hypothetical protein PLK55_01625 [archaeon]|nr:hypothetical protein [archaeon]
MVNVNNLIVKGIFGYPCKDTSDQKFAELYNGIQLELKNYMEKVGYLTDDITMVDVLEHSYSKIHSNPKLFSTVIHYSMKRVYTPDLKYKLKSLLKVKTISDEQKLYYNWLKGIRAELPYNIDLLFKWDSKESRIIIEVISMPVIYFQITQLNRKSDISNFEYSKILFENIKFLNELSTIISTTVISEPKSLEYYINVPISNKLSEYGYEKVSELLIEGYRYLEMGDKEKTIHKLIGVIEHFFEEFSKKTTDESCGLHKPEDNMRKIQKKMIISQEIESTIEYLVYTRIYKKLKDKDHKQEEDIDYNVLKLYFSYVESTIEYLLEIQKLKMHTTSK